MTVRILISQRGMKNCIDMSNQKRNGEVEEDYPTPKLGTEKEISIK